MIRLGIIGLPGCGKRTVFSALTHQPMDSLRTGEPLIGTLPVPDPRLDTLAVLCSPKKVTPISIEYFLPGAQEPTAPLKGESSPLHRIRDCHGLLQVIRNFSGLDGRQPDPLGDLLVLNQELVFIDFGIAEKRLERMELDRKRGKKADPIEQALLERCLERLEQEVPLRKEPDLAEAPALRGYAFLSAKPTLTVFNNDDENEVVPERSDPYSAERWLAIRGRLEQELSEMAPDEARGFRSAYGIEASAKERIIRESFELMGLIAFFTVVGDEIREWAVKEGAPALDAAGAVHSDMKKGFIRAEVISYADLTEAGDFQNAKKKGVVRLEGKTYEVRDGDIINFRFNV